MNDFDFDELDKAVNTLVAKKNAKSSKTKSYEPAVAVKDITPKLEAPEPQLDLPAALEPKELPAKTAADSTPKKDDQADVEEAKLAAEVHQPPKAAILPRHGGRLGVKPALKSSVRGGFIDNVTSKPVVKVSRVAAEVKPATSNVQPEGPKAEEASIKTEPEKELDTKKNDGFDWPDPLDFDESPKTESVESSKPIDDPESFGKEPEPASPFIANAKVEKRPLGAYAEKVAQDLAKPTDDEKDEVAKEEQKAVKEPEPAKTDNKKEEPEKPEDAENHVVESAMMSIPQQYKSEHKQANQTERNVFDTKEYHPPLLTQTAHASGGKGAWGAALVILLIVALLAVGVYFGFLYFVQSS